MSEDSFQERSEQATPRRREKARDEGRVARSMDLNSAAVILLGGASLLALGPLLMHQSQDMMRGMLQNAVSVDVSAEGIGTFFSSTLMQFFVIIGPVVLAMFAVGFLASIAQVGFHVSTKALELKFDKFDVVKGLQRLFATRTLVAMVRDTLKLFLLGYVAYKALMAESEQFLALSDMAVPQLAATIGQVALMVTLKIGGAMLFIAVLDYLYQRFDFEKSIRMSHEDIKEEHRDTEGSPTTKSRIRQIQREQARRRMMQEVPRADVVITNPTHLAIALKYNPEQMNAPQVIAKGERLIAQRIKQIAIEHEIPVIEDKPLARALYKVCEVGDIVPATLFRAVAEVLAYVYKLKGKAVG